VTPPTEKFWSTGELGTLTSAVAATAPQAGTTRVVAVDGPSGSGKSTLAQELSHVMADAPVVRMDDLYPGWDGLDDAAPRLREWVLDPLSRGEPARYRRFDWVADRYAEWHEVAPAPVVIVEGCASGARTCGPWLSLIIWVEAAAHVRMARGVDRDGDEYRPHWQRWAAQETVHFAREGTRDRADVRLTTG